MRSLQSTWWRARCLRAKDCTREDVGAVVSRNFTFPLGTVKTLNRVHPTRMEYETNKSFVLIFGVAHIFVDTNTAYERAQIAPSLRHDFTLSPSSLDTEPPCPAVHRTLPSSLPLNTDSAHGRSSSLSVCCPGYSKYTLGPTAIFGSRYEGEVRTNSRI